MKTISKRIWKLIAIFMIAFSVYANGQQTFSIPGGNWQSLINMKGITKFERGVLFPYTFDSFNVKFDSVSWTYYQRHGDSGFHAYDGIGWFKILSEKDSDLIKTWVGSGGGGGLSTVYGINGITVNGGDTVNGELKMNIADSVTKYVTPAMLNDESLSIKNFSISVIADSLDDYVNYPDSTIVFATPAMLNDTVHAIRLAIPTNNNQLSNGSNYATSTALLDSVTGRQKYIDSITWDATKSDLNNAKSVLLTAIADSVIGRVKYTDSLTIYATPKNVKDSANSVRSAIPTNNNQLANGSNYAVSATTLVGYGITNAWTKTEADSRYFERADSNTGGNAVTLSYFNTHSTPTQTLTLTGDVTGVGTNTVTTTIKSSVALSGSPTTTTQSAGDNSTKIATTAFVTNAVAAITNTVTANYVPYTGATTNVNIGSNSFYTTGSVGIGTTSPATPMEVVETSTVTPRGVANSQYSNSANPAQFHLRKSRGTPSVPLTVVTGDVIGRVMYEAYDGSNFLTMADIRATVTGSVTTTRTPTYLSFYTATDATPSVMTERLRIGAAGDFNYFGSTSGTLTVTPPAAITSYTVTPPSAVGSVGQVQSISSVASNSATLGWITPLTSFSVTASSTFSVTGSPITGGTGTINIAFAPTTVFTITPANSVTVDANNGNSQTITMNRATTTFTISNILEGRQNAITLEVLQDGTGSRGLAMSTTVKVPNNLGGLPPISTTANAIDVWTIQKIHGNIWVFVALNGN